MSTQIKVALAEDHIIVREGLENLLAKEEDIEIVGVADHGKRLLSILRTQNPDIVLLDIGMPKMDGFETAKEIIKMNKDIRIIMLTTYKRGDYINRLKESGVFGYIVKDNSFNELVTAIRKVYAGHKYFSQEVISAGWEYATSKSGVLKVNLTNREKEVLTCIGQGMTTREIAMKLKIQPVTVETHRSNLLAKLECKNSLCLVRYAAENGY